MSAAEFCWINQRMEKAMNFQPPDPERFGSCLKCNSLIEESEQSGGICFECHAVDSGKEPAFPVGANEYGGHGTCFGLTVRDYFAAKADIEVYAPVDTLYRKLGRNPTVNEMADWIAEVRFIEADAMLAARTK
ncbi:hypothetical protein D3C86_1508390 [compost metagenome]